MHLFELSKGARLKLVWKFALFNEDKNKTGTPVQMEKDFKKL